MSLTQTAVNNILNFEFKSGSITSSAIWTLGLFTTIPTFTTGGTEVSGGSYARQSITMNTVGTGTISNSNALTFSGMPACTLVGVGLFDNSGTLWIYQSISSTGVTSGQSATVAIGAIVVQEAGSFCNAYHASIFRHVFGIATRTPPANHYLALYSTATTVAGGGTELSGSGYSRTAFAGSLFPTASGSSGSIANNAQLNLWTPSGAQTTTNYIIQEASSGSSPLFFGTLASSITTNSGNVPYLVSGDLVLAFGTT